MSSQTPRKTGKQTTRNNKVVELSSAGAVFSTNFTGNQFKLLNIIGSVWDSGLDGKFGFEAYRIRLSNYFSPSVFAGFDYFRVKGCTTVLRWRGCPETPPIMGDVYYYIDKDAEDPSSGLNAENIGNRRDLQHRSFTNEVQTHKIKWTPYLVERDAPNSDPVDYVQPRSRWLNTSAYNDMRFGTFVMLATTPNANTQYSSNDAAVSVRHIITLELKGQKSVQVQVNGFGSASLDDQVTSQKNVSSTEAVL